MSNFTFLQSEWPAIHEDAVATEANIFVAPRTCAFYARRTLEKMTKWMFAHDSYLQMPYRDNLASLIHEPTFKDTLGPGIFNSIRLIHKLGNLAVHSDTNVNVQDALNLTRCVHHVMKWMAKSYTKNGIVVGAFDDTLVPRPAAPQVNDRNVEQLKTLQESLSSKDRAFDEAQKKLAATEEEVASLRAEIQQIKKENQKTIGDEDYTEAQTRDLFIDLLLKEAGWDPNGENVPEYEVIGMPKKDGSRTGKGFIDYVLWGDDGLPLAVVEAKRTKANAEVGKRQAELYADCLEQMTGQRPVIFYTNGYETWIWDDQQYPPREVQGFYAQDQLQLLINRRTSRTDITKATVNRDICDRFYHEEAIKRIMSTYADDNARQSLVVMATGTGKTRLSIATVEILMKHNWVRRVLFLADRTALINQAKKNFNKHLPNASLVNLVEDKEDETARVVFSTYPTIMNLIDDSKRDGAKKFGVGHFDLIIIDEAHRSVYQKFGAIFDYFDAMLLGLTATPRDEVDRDTYGLFGLEQGNPTYAYDLDQAIADEYLVGFKAMSVPLKFQREGIAYDDLSAEEKEEYEAEFFDEETGELPSEIGAPALNKWLFNENTVDLVLKKLMEDGQKVEGGDRIAKTIIFAKNHNHADFIVKRFDKNYPKAAGKICRLVDNQTKYVQSLIDDFYVPNKPPYIAVSVDMLDTGIDVPEILNLVFFKLVRSKTKFWQMIGRGTRLRKDLFGPGKDKEFFFIFDYCQNLEFFGNKPEGYETRVQDSVKTKIFKRRLALIEKLPINDLVADPPQPFLVKGKPLETGDSNLRDDLIDQLQDTVARMDTDNFIVRPKRRLVEDFSKRERWGKLSDSDLLDLNSNVASLPVDDDDEEMARRFDLLMLNLQLAILESSPSQERYQGQVMTIAGGLEEKQAIPSVAAQLDLILEMQRDEYWQSITLPMIEATRRRVRDLVKFIDRSGSQEDVFTDFEDEMGEAQEVTGLVRKDPKLANYRLRVERFIRDHDTHPTIQRIKTNQPLLDGDIDSLEAILYSEDVAGSREQFVATFGDEEPLGRLVRRIVGLDQNAAKEAFSEFLADGNYNADQIQFVNLIVEHLVQNGLMRPEKLFEPPFSDMHAEGVIGILGDKAERVVNLLEEINANAVG